MNLFIRIWAVLDNLDRVIFLPDSYEYVIIFSIAARSCYPVLHAPWLTRISWVCQRLIQSFWLDDLKDRTCLQFFSKLCQKHAIIVILAISNFWCHNVIILGLEKQHFQHFHFFRIIGSRKTCCIHRYSPTQWCGGTNVVQKAFVHSGLL